MPEMCELMIAEQTDEHQTTNPPRLIRKPTNRNQSSRRAGDDSERLQTHRSTDWEDGSDEVRLRQIESRYECDGSV